MMYVNLMLIESGKEARSLHFKAKAENLKTILKMAEAEGATPGAIIENTLSALFNDYETIEKKQDALKIVNGDLVEQQAVNE